MSDLQITSEQMNGAYVIRLAGDPEIMPGEPLDAMIDTALKAKPTKVVIDLSGLLFIASLMAGSLVRLQTFLKRQGGAAVIASPNKSVRDALTRMRVVSVIPVHDSMEQALAS